MSPSPVTAAPESQTSADFTDFHVEEHTVASTGKRTEIKQSVAEEDPVVKVGILPLFLIAAGIGIYLIAIAAFTSFLGVAIGVVLMVAGAILYTCQGLMRRTAPYPAAPDIPFESDDVSAALPYGSDRTEDSTFALPELQEEYQGTTTHVPSAV